MLTLTDFATIAGAAGITVAIMALVKALWHGAPEPWVTWGVAEGIVWIGGLLTGPWTLSRGVLLLISGMVVVATVTALGSHAGVRHVTTPSAPTSGRVSS